MHRILTTSTVDLIKKAEHRKTDAFEVWCWRLLRIPWTTRRANQSILKEINPEYSLDIEAKAPVLWPLWICEEPAHWKTPWCSEKLKAGGKGTNRGWVGWIASLTQWTWVWASSRRWWRTESIACSMGFQSQTRVSNWAATTSSYLKAQQQVENSKDILSCSFYWSGT